MKVIYIIASYIYGGLKLLVIRDVQQSLYMGKCKYIMKILKNGDKNDAKPKSGKKYDYNGYNAF
jgi:hypothetical protein